MVDEKLEINNKVLEEAWNSACEGMRRDGEDPDELLRKAAANFKKYSEAWFEELAKANDPNLPQICRDLYLSDEPGKIGKLARGLCACRYATDKSFLVEYLGKEPILVEGALIGLEMEDLETDIDISESEYFGKKVEIENSLHKLVITEDCFCFVPRGDISSVKSGELRDFEWKEFQKYFPDVKKNIQEIAQYMFEDKLDKILARNKKPPVYKKITRKID